MPNPHQPINKYKIEINIFNFDHNFNWNRNLFGYSPFKYGVKCAYSNTGTPRLLDIPTAMKYNFKIYHLLCRALISASSLALTWVTFIQQWLGLQIPIPPDFQTFLRPYFLNLKIYLTFACWALFLASSQVTLILRSIWSLYQICSQYCP